MATLRLQDKILDFGDAVFSGNISIRRIGNGFIVSFKMTSPSKKARTQRGGFGYVFLFSVVADTDARGASVEIFCHTTKDVGDLVAAVCALPMDGESESKNDDEDDE